MSSEPIMHEDLKRVLSDWDAGKPIRALRLGHAGQNVRQSVVYAHAFRMLRDWLADGAKFKDAARKEDRAEELTKAEHEAAHSLAFVAYKFGWSHAISNFSEDKYITVQKP